MKNSFNTIKDKYPSSSGKNQNVKKYAGPDRSSNRSSVNNLNQTPLVTINHSSKITLMYKKDPRHMHCLIMESLHKYQ